MNLIERYLQAVGKELPSHQREDILKELRSSLYDALEEEGGEPAEERVVALLKEMGPPRQVAASYYPAGQYLIGPALYPTFLMVLQIAITAVLGVQVVMAIVSMASAGAFSPVDAILAFLSTIPAVVGSVALVFWLLQRTDVQMDAEAPFDPRNLPALEPAFEPVNRGEQAASIFFTVLVLALLAQFARGGGFTWLDGTGVFENPVIASYFPWILLSGVVGVVMDIVLLWRGRWETSTRVGSILSNLFSLAILVLLIRGHNLWLEAAGAGGLLESLAGIPDLQSKGGQLLGMLFFRWGLAIATIVVGVETAVMAYEQLRAGTRAKLPAAGLVPRQG